MVKPVPNFWKRIDENFELSWMRSRIAPRVIARTSETAEIPIGAHDVVPANPETVRRATAADLIVAHVPFTTMARFERKVANVRRILDDDDKLFGEGLALHWRRWVAIADEGGLEEEFGRMVFARKRIERLRSEGVICSAAEVFSDRQPGAEAVGEG